MTKRIRRTGGTYRGEAQRGHRFSDVRAGTSRGHYNAVMAAIDVVLPGLRSAGETPTVSAGVEWAPWADRFRDLLLPRETPLLIQLGTGAGKTSTSLQLLSEFFFQHTTLSEWAGGLRPDERVAPKPCGCPACAEFTASARCGDSSDGLGDRLGFDTWKTDPASPVAAHVVALMDAPATTISTVLDEWNGAVSGREHRTVDGTGPHVPSFHLISPWILLVHRLLVLSWRTGAARASRTGLARIRRRSRDLGPASAGNTRPRCAGRAPRGPSTPRMSSPMAIRGGALH